MDNPGAFQLTANGNAFAITSAGTQVGDWIDGFDGITALTAQFQFMTGSGSSGTVTAYLQTSIDQGQTPIDIAAVAFTTASATSVVNLCGLTPKTTPVTPWQQALSAGTCVDGILGDRFRVVVVSTGTYLNSSSLNVTGVAR